MSNCDLSWWITYIITLTDIQKLIQGKKYYPNFECMLLSTVQWRIGISLQLTVCICVCQKANIMHCGTLHDTCQDREMAVLCFSNSPAPSGRPCSFSHCRETEDHSISFFLHLSFILTLSCLISALLLSLLHSYISVIPLLFCLIS